jgi:tetratricopeptide (TPR) repeat protein
LKKTGDEYFDSSEFQELLAEYETAVNTGEPVFMDTDELSEIADFYQMTGQQQEAKKAINLALSLSPGAIAPLTYCIHEALYHGDTKEAWKLLDQIVEKDEPDYIYNRGEILIVEDRIDEADSYFREEFRTVPPEEYQDFVIDVANIYSDYGINDKALEWMSRAKPENTPEFKELMARTLFGIGKYKDSERLWGELIDSDPFQKRYWNALASVQFMNEEYSDSIESSEYAIAIDPKDPDGLIAKANGLYRIGNYEEAREYYSRYLKQEPEDEFAMLHEGTCLINIGQPDEAIAKLKEAVETAAPDSPYLADIYQELAFAYSEKEEPDEALNYLDMTSTLDCDHVQVLVIKGHIMLAAGRIKEAEDYFRDAVICSDDAKQTLLKVIVSLYDNHYLEATYKMLQKYFQIASEDNTEGYAYMALCCHDLHLEDKYLKYLKKACSINPSECRMVLAHLFPKDVEPEKYYDYMREKLKN